MNFIQDLIDNRTLNELAPARRNVLIIEDDFLCQMLIRRIVLSIDENASISITDTIEAAKTLLEKRNFSLVISDYFLRDLDTGMDLWNELTRKSQKMPFLLTSWIDPSDLRLMSRDHEVKPAFLSKPIKTDDCREAIKRLLEAENSKN